MEKQFNGKICVEIKRYLNYNVRECIRKEDLKWPKYAKFAENPHQQVTLSAIPTRRTSAGGSLMYKRLGLLSMGKLRE